jgi:hypothetical protein
VPKSNTSMCCFGVLRVFFAQKILINHFLNFYRGKNWDNMPKMLRACLAACKSEILIPEINICPWADILSWEDSLDTGVQPNMSDI